MGCNINCTIRGFDLTKIKDFQKYLNNPPEVDMEPRRSLESSVITPLKVKENKIWGHR